MQKVMYEMSDTERRKLIYSFHKNFHLNYFSCTTDRVTKIRIEKIITYQL